MVPLRRYLIVGQHGVLPYPEGVACAEVLVAGEEGGVSAYYIVGGLVGFIYKFLTDGLKLKNAAIGMDVYPSLLGVGFIVGPKISSYMFVGAIFGWLILTPLITFFGSGVTTAIFPSSVPLGEMSYSEPCWVAVLKGYGQKATQVLRTDADMDPKWLIVGIVALIIFMALLPQIPVGFSSSQSALPCFRYDYCNNLVDSTHNESLWVDRS